MESIEARVMKYDRQVPKNVLIYLGEARNLINLMKRVLDSAPWSVEDRIEAIGLLPERIKTAQNILKLSYWDNGKKTLENVLKLSIELLKDIE